MAIEVEYAERKTDDGTDTQHNAERMSIHSIICCLSTELERAFISAANTDSREDEGRDN